MATRKPKTVVYRRKREQKTNYSKRLKLLLSGEKRLVVRFSNQKISTQLSEFTAKGDRILVAVDSLTLKKLGWGYSCKNFPAAYLTGLLMGKKVLEKGYQKVILDTGAKAPLHKGKVYAFLKGVVDAGLTIFYGDPEKIFPSEEFLTGRQIKSYAEQIKGKEEYQQRFAQYLKSNSGPEKITDTFEQVKKKIMS